MVTQRVTIAKIGGEAGQATLRRFRGWLAARTVEDADEWEPAQWPVEIRQQADVWGDNLCAHGHQPPVVFFLQYIDGWSFSPPLNHLAGEPPKLPLSALGLISIFADRHELYCVQLPLSEYLTRALKRLRTRGQWHEDQLFATLTLEAATAWHELVDGGALVFLRQVLSGSTTDEEVIASVANAPPWFALQQSVSLPDTPTGGVRMGRLPGN